MALISVARRVRKATSKNQGSQACSSECFLCNDSVWCSGSRLMDAGDLEAARHFRSLPLARTDCPNKNGFGFRVSKVGLQRPESMRLDFFSVGAEPATVSGRISTDLLLQDELIISPNRKGHSLNKKPGLSGHRWVPPPLPITTAGCHFLSDCGWWPRLHWRMRTCSRHHALERAGDCASVCHTRFHCVAVHGSPLCC